MKTRHRILAAAAAISLFASTAVAQQNLTLPQASQAAGVMQQVGLTQLKVAYHSPLVKGRTIWGDLVPYNEVWRCGANENTVFHASTDILVEGQPLAAGSYGLHMIPTPADWTIIFSRVSDAWGSFVYDKKDDALRVTVRPHAASFQEWLSYRFTDLQPESAVLTLRWEKLEIPVRIAVDVHETVYRSMVAELRGLPGFFWQPHYQLARYCFDNGIHPAEAVAAVDKSIGINPTFPNLNLKAEIAAREGKAGESEQLTKKALGKADEIQLNAYGYELMGKGKLDRAIEIFRLNVKRYPDSWNVYDSLGEALMNKGNRKESLSNYETALGKAPEKQHERIRAMIAKVKKMEDSAGL